jgi:hypothetical protein
MFGDVVEKREKQMENETIFVRQEENSVLHGKKTTFVVELHGHGVHRQRRGKMFVDIEKDGREFPREETFGQETEVLLQDVGHIVGTEIVELMELETVLDGLVKTFDTMGHATEEREREN